MNTMHFDRLTRTFAQFLSRRGLVGALGLTLLGVPSLAEAKKKKRKKKKLKKNQFGCVDVGKACRGNSANCCSGICEGKKPKKGKKDKSRCLAHDEGDCQADQDVCVNTDGTGCTTSGGEFGICFRTTGKASFCAAFEAAACFPCAKDADCQAVCGPDAACIVCTECAQEGGTVCAGAESCDFPP